MNTECPVCGSRVVWQGHSLLAYALGSRRTLGFQCLDCHENWIATQEIDRRRWRPWRQEKLDEKGLTVEYFRALNSEPMPWARLRPTHEVCRGKTPVGFSSAWLLAGRRQGKSEMNKALLKAMMIEKPMKRRCQG